MDETRKEPTTAEAFATVRSGWQVMAMLEPPFGHSGDEESGTHDEDCGACAHEALLAWSQEAAHALALLERRLGAMARALLAVKQRLQNPITFSGVEAEREINAALTDAPLVFTLEEVRRVVGQVWGDDVGTERVRRGLLALRGTGGER